MHRARRRRYTLTAFEGATASLQRQTWRPGFLLYNLRLDDVELASHFPRLGGDRRAL